MLYLSTRNTTDSYTAYRALHESCTPDGGGFVPLRLPEFTQDDLADIRSQTPCDAIARILNALFGVHLSGWDVEGTIGRQPIKPMSLPQRLLFAECWRNPHASFDYLLSNLYALATNHTNTKVIPDGWARIGIEIALLFGLYAAMEIAPEQRMDMAVATGDFADIIAVLYGKDMGLPIDTIVCTCNENSTAWDLFTKGEFHTNTPVVHTILPELDITNPDYLEFLIYKCFGVGQVQLYFDACQRKATYTVEEEQLKILNDGVFVSVVSAERVDSILSGMHRANLYHIDPYTALIYGGLQDYRAHTGINKDTLILFKQRPTKERV